MVPASASRGFVAPISFRADLTTPSPSHTCKWNVVAAIGVGMTS